MSEDNENMFSRWSRRKRAVEKEIHEEQVAEPDPAKEIAEPENDEEEAVLLERLGLPVPESLTEGDDFSVFMKADVPEFLRKRALRVLWRSNPVLANLDGLNDYDEDFNAPELTQKVLATAYQVGKGIFREVVEDSVEEIDDPQTIEAFVPEDKEEIAPPTENDASEYSYEFEENDAPSKRPRRMRFMT